jgi:ABC-type amino acid transport substrate-binding protein
MQTKRLDLLCRGQLGRLLVLACGLHSGLAVAQITTRIGIMLVSEQGLEKKAPNFDIVREYCRKARIVCEIVPLPTQRAFAELQADRIQFVISLEHKPPGMNPIKIVKVESAPIVVVARKSSISCEELQTMSLAALRNVLYARQLAERCPGLRISWTNSYSQCMQMFRSGRVDGVIGVAKNFKHKPPLVELKDGDFLSQVDTAAVWLFGNAQSQYSEASYRLQEVLPRG